MINTYLPLLSAFPGDGGTFWPFDFGSDFTLVSSEIFQMYLKKVKMVVLNWILLLPMDISI